MTNDPDDFYDSAEPAHGKYVYPGLPSTLVELRDVLMQYDAHRPRSLQRELGPSELGTPCDQQIARKLVGGVQSYVHEPAWAPFQGTAVHNSMRDVITFWNGQLGRERWLADSRVMVAPASNGMPAVEGESDAYDKDSNAVVDWKHVGITALEKLRKAREKGLPTWEQVSPEYRTQTQLYGLGHARLGRPVKFVRLVMLARSWKFDDSEEWTEPYDEALALAALDRYYDVVRQVRELDLDNHPDQIALVPATPTSMCWWCPFRRYGRPADRDGCPGKSGA